VWLLQAGYRHVDTAAQYGVEKKVHIKKKYGSILDEQSSRGQVKHALLIFRPAKDLKLQWRLGSTGKICL
jgi:hypothetical protein